jgi:hypothetical protein
MLLFSGFSPFSGQPGLGGEDGGQHLPVSASLRRRPGVDLMNLNFGKKNSDKKYPVKLDQIAATFNLILSDNDG